MNVQIDFIFSWLTFVDPQNFSINSSVQKKSAIENVSGVGGLLVVLELLVPVLLVIENQFLGVVLQFIDEAETVLNEEQNETEYHGLVYRFCKSICISYELNFLEV